MSSTLNLNHFALKLFNEISNGKKENVFISPFSISTALSMCYTGARGDTANQMKTMLAFNNLSNEQVKSLTGDLIKSLNSLEKDVSLNTANRIYANAGFEIKKEYINELKTSFHSELEQVNFSQSAETSSKINKWVSEQTKEKIKDLISPTALNALTRLVLVNAIYFKGNWLHKFDKEHTYDEDFTCINGQKHKVKMMKLLNKKFHFQMNPNGLLALVCKFPYMGNGIAMSIILPHEGVPLDQVEKNLNGENLTSVLSGGFPGKVHVYIPKFKLEFKTELSENLKALGATLAFDNTKADFTGITEKESLYISQVVHQAVVEVNEEGTEAAAATGVIMMTRALAIHDLPPEEFKCNRPFIFVIHDQAHNTPLFMGKYVKP